MENLRQICETHGVSFLDINKRLSNKEYDGKWLFVDRIHLTDEGNQIIAKILKNEVICK